MIVNYRLSNINEAKRQKTIDKFKKYGPFPIENRYGMIMQFGTDTKKDAPPTLYIRTRTRLTPILKGRKATVNEKGAELLKTKIQECLENAITVNPHFDNRFLTNVELSAKNLSEGKDAYLRYDVFVRPKNPDRIGIIEPSVKNLGRIMEKRIMNILTNTGFKLKLT